MKIVKQKSRGTGAPRKTDRARLFWRRAGARGERVGAIGKSVVKGMWNRRPRGED